MQVKNPGRWIVGIVGVLTWTILYFIRIPEEEKMMVEEFGQEYKHYMKRTKKNIPLDLLKFKPFAGHK